ncbi:hypothetical protein [Lentzea sp. NEAU-D7]|uniref:hypothetical protein n=1 Tax=Lentzea sp. NEAU-D7 TaxID=2994667 RepID=UPI00224AE951|nr:hypothetical protein [Lentzea sp. NEAU-D7]MCX2954198.1 hypothetical protein [Lentzea sp. NEAU-D7]
MGMIYDYFAAPSDEVAAAVIDDGPTGLFRTVEAKWFDPLVVMGTLEELLTGRPYTEVLADPRWGHDVARESDGGPLVLSVTDGLRDGLAGMDEPIAVAAVWSRTEELDGYDPADLACVLDELKDLAAEAVRSGERLYCWVCV